MVHEQALSSPLRPAPKSVTTAAGHPAFGTYSGVVDSVDLTRLSGAYQLAAPLRLLKHKKWHYHLVVTPEVVAACAIVDLGYAANAFVTAVELSSRQVLVDRSFMGVPGPLAFVNDHPAEGANARLVSPLGARFALARPEGRERYKVSVDAIDLPVPRRVVRWRGEVLAAGGAPALTVVSAVGQDGIVNVTQKWAGLLAFGELVAGDRRFVLDGGVAGLDYTHGYLARHTAWHWAMALGRLEDGTPIGLNLVEGFNEDNEESNENALWAGKRLIPLGRARFEFLRQDPLDTWRIRTVDGAVDLTFRPIHVHREERDYVVVRSRFAQPTGTFEGKVTIDGAPVQVALAGVAEDQDMVW